MNFLLLLVTLLFPVASFVQASAAVDVASAVQQTDTTDAYADKVDTLSAAAVSVGQGNYMSRTKELRTEVITAAGLCKMACCNLAESFENSASVTVGYSDAVTGARQIRLLGLSGTYTQMLDENRPVMRGLASPFGLGYVPGQWLSSIQIAKGAPSVINGVESITGQINLEHRKPTDEVPFFLNASLMSEAKADLNLASSLQLGDAGKWSTVILGHVSGNFMDMDMNGDGFLDDPRQCQVNLSNRWLYYDPNGVQVRFGVRLIHDRRDGGQSAAASAPLANPWLSQVVNNNLNAYCKVGVPLNEDNSQNIAFVADYNDYFMGSSFGRAAYRARQASGSFNALYQNQVHPAHHFTLGLSTTVDAFDENLTRTVPTMSQTFAGVGAPLVNAGAFGEYTFHAGDSFSLIAGLRADWYNDGGLSSSGSGSNGGSGSSGGSNSGGGSGSSSGSGSSGGSLGSGDGGVRISPRLTIKYSPVEELVLRLNAGRGLRRATPIVDNIGVLSTSKAYFCNGSRCVGSSGTAIYGSSGSGSSGSAVPLFMQHPLEDAWVFGGNATVYLPFGASESTYISLDYFHTAFARQLVVDYERYDNVIDFYMCDGRSFTDTYQLDFSVEPVRRFTTTLTFRYTDARLTQHGLLRERPMTSRFKGVLNLQYTLNMKWIFDATASLNGPCRLYDFMKDQYPSGYSPVYPLLYAQVTRRFKGCDIYIGGENLTGYTQKNPIINAAHPYDSAFDASCIWGPLMGVKVYAGIRVTLWKKE